MRKGVNDVLYILCSKYFLIVEYLDKIFYSNRKTKTLPLYPDVCDLRIDSLR